MQYDRKDGQMLSIFTIAESIRPSGDLLMEITKDALVFGGMAIQVSQVIQAKEEIHFGLLSLTS